MPLLKKEYYYTYTIIGIISFLQQRIWFIYCVGGIFIKFLQTINTEVELILLRSDNK